MVALLQPALHGSLLKQEQVRVGPLHVRSMATHFGASGGRQQPFCTVVPGGHTPASGIVQVPPWGGCTQASSGPQLPLPHGMAPPSALPSSAGQSGEQFAPL